MSRRLAEELLRFINSSSTSYHAAETIKSELDNSGYIELVESDKWKINKGGRYYVRKNTSAIIAFEIGDGNLEEEGFRLIGAHNDSPGFRVKPKSEMISDGNYLKLNTEVYGGPILNTWFDRPLSIAGRVVLKGDNPLKPKIQLVNIRKPILIIPNIAIHLNRNVNEGYSINKQKDTLPLLGLVNENLQKEDYLINLLCENISVCREEIIDFDLFLYEFEKGCLLGIQEEFISSSRLDDLWMIFAGLKALKNSKLNKATKVMICIDNEEIGSLTAQGADSSFIRNVLERITLVLNKDKEDFYRTLSNSVMISADLAHAVHPNLGDKHDPTNRPILGNGPVIKLSASGSYSTDGYTSAIFKEICNEINIPYQTFVNRSDMRGGTTIGPIMASELSIPVIDMGAPVLGMHSIRELASVKDNESTVKLFTRFFEL